VDCDMKNTTLLRIRHLIDASDVTITSLQTRSSVVNQSTSYAWTFTQSIVIDLI